MITLKRLMEVLDYDPSTGFFTWRYRSAKDFQEGRFGRQHAADAWNGQYGGETAGTPADGYVNIRIDGISYRAHRLAWLYVYGVMPPRLDHKDLVRNHNWIDNLRIATDSQNQFNKPRQKNNSSGYKGVTRVGERWCARITIDKRQTHIGHFDLPEQAHAAYCEAATKYYGEFARFE